jgi:hypothetical protein
MRTKPGRKFSRTLTDNARMHIVTAENRRTGTLEFCSQPMPAHQAEQLADFLRRCTKLKIAVEVVVQAISDAVHRSTRLTHSELLPEIHK